MIWQTGQRGVKMEVSTGDSAHKAFVHIEYSMKLVVLIPGFGDPHWDKKVHILRKNVATVHKYFDEYVFRIIQYTHDKELPEDIMEHPHVEIIRDKGILGRNLHVHATPDIVDAYNTDFVMILLDDVELADNFDWERVILLKNAMELDIVSPALTSPDMTVWNFMVKSMNPDILATEMTRVELFCYLMTPETYKKYYQFIDPDNPWMWGMDFMLHSHMKLRAGLVHTDCMIHHFWRKQDTHDPKHCPRKDSERFLKLHNTSWDELHALPSVLRIAALEPSST